MKVLWKSIVACSVSLGTVLIYLHTRKPFNGTSNILDGCYHVYLDLGSNRGVQIRKLYEPSLFPHAKVLPIFDKYFGKFDIRDLSQVCSIGFEPNRAHDTLLWRLQESYQACGWKVIVNLGVGAGKSSGVTKYVDIKSSYVNWRKLGWLVQENPSEEPLKDEYRIHWPHGVAGRLLDGNMSQYEGDNVTTSEVRQVRIAQFINTVVAHRRIPLQQNNTLPPSVVMKIDVEGRELDIIPDLVMSGALRHLDNIHVDWTKDKWTNETTVKGLAEAMLLLTQLGRDRGLLHTTEVLGEDDESYGEFDGPFPIC